jgi:transposase
LNPEEKEVSLKQNNSSQGGFSSMSKYTVKLTRKQREQLETLCRTGTHSAQSIRHASILLQTDSGDNGPRWSIPKIQEMLGVSRSLIKTVRKRFVQEGWDGALFRRKQPERPEKRKITGEQEAHLIAVLCTQQPEGQERWTVRLLRERIIELEIVESVSEETVRMVLHKNELKPWQKKQWCVGPTGADSSYAYHMEDVLHEYVHPYDAKRPRVCVDEGSVQFLNATRDPIAMQPGQVKKEDYQYERAGYWSVFLACEPLVGTRMCQVKARRTKKDFAHFIRDVVDQQYPEAEKVILIMDNLNTHSPASLYEAFEPEEAMRLCQKIEIHSTPVHGSWLNMAEIELSVLGRQVLHERLADQGQVQQRVQAWQAKRNQQQARINWRFTAEDARIKLKRLYPVTEPDHLNPLGSNVVG